MHQKILIVPIVLFLCVVAQAKSVSLAFAGIEGGQESDFKDRLERDIYQKIIFLPEVDVVDLQKISHIKEMKGLPSPLLAPPQAESLALKLDCRTLLYGKIERAEITAHRYWFFPIYGYYRGNLEMHFWLYDVEQKSFRFDDKISLQTALKKGYCGFENFGRNMALAAESRLKIENEWVRQAKEKIFERMQLVLKGLQRPAEMAQTDSGGGVFDFTATADTSASAKDTSVHIVKSDSAATDSSRQKSAPAPAAPKDTAALDQKPK